MKTYHRCSQGPQKYFLGAYEELVEQRPAVVLSPRQYCTVSNRLTGGAKIVMGMDGGGGRGLQYMPCASAAASEHRHGDPAAAQPAVDSPCAYEEIGPAIEATVLSKRHYLVVRNNLNGPSARDDAAACLLQPAACPLLPPQASSLKLQASSFKLQACCCCSLLPAPCCCLPVPSTCCAGGLCARPATTAAAWPLLPPPTPPRPCPLAFVGPPDLHSRTWNGSLS